MSVENQIDYNLEYPEVWNAETFLLYANDDLYIFGDRINQFANWLIDNWTLLTGNISDELYFQLLGECSQECDVSVYSLSQLFADILSTMAIDLRLGIIEDAIRHLQQRDYGSLRTLYGQNYNQEEDDDRND